MNTRDDEHEALEREREREEGREEAADKLKGCVL